MNFTDYKNRAVSELRSYTQLKSRAEALSRQVNMLTEIDSTPCGQATSGSNSADAANGISRLDELKQELSLINFRIACIESTLGSLADNDKEIITAFYITRQRNTVNILARKNYTDRSCIYRRAQKALEAYIYACYGVTKN